MEEEAKTTHPKRKPRPAQKLYVPPAQRYTKKTPENNTIEPTTQPEETSDQNEGQNLTDTASNMENDTEQKSETPVDPLVIMLQDAKIDEKKSIDRDKEEMERAIVNINRKSRPLIKHVNVGNSHILHIDVKTRDVSLANQVASWEDLFNEDDNISEVIEQDEPEPEKLDDIYSDEDDDIYKRNSEPGDLDHVIELYDFPSSFKTPDIMQLFHEVNKQSMYIKWCDETHALLVLSTPAQATRALKLRHDMIKTRTMNSASSVAQQVAQKSDLRPAMKRPQTNMQTARRLITSHLGAKSRISKEEQAREREELRKAKEMKKAQKQLEYDAWEGNPRPSTA